jgi:hypothetical protein
MGNSTWVNSLDPFTLARGASANTFTTWRDVSPLPLPASYANELKIGTAVELEARGEFSTTGTPTLQLGFIYGAVAGAAGGTVLAQTAATATASGAAAFPWHLHYTGIVTAIGATGAIIYGHGIADIGSALTTVTSTFYPVTAAARSVGSLDTTTMKLWGVGAAWGASSASNIVIVDVFSATIYNQGKT